MKRFRHINEASEVSIADLDEYITNLNGDIKSLKKRIDIVNAYINEKNSKQSSGIHINPQGGYGQPGVIGNPNQFRPQQGQYVKVGEFDGKIIVRDNIGRTFLVDQSGRAVPFNINNQQQNNRGYFDPSHNHLVGGKEDEEEKGNWFTGTLGGLADGVGKIGAMPFHALSGFGRGLVSETEHPKKKFRINRK